jgi:outer membrane protein TolC
VEVITKAKSLANENLKLIRDYYDQGLVQKADVLSVNVRVSEVENQLSYAISNVRNGSDYLALLLGEEEMDDRVFKPQDRVIDSLIIAEYPTSLPESRKDLMAMQMSVEGYGRMLASGQMKLLPRINAFGSYQLYDENLFGFGADGYLLGVSLSWQIFDGNKNIGRVQKSRAQYEKAQLENDQYVQQSELELKKARRQLADAEKKVALSRLAYQQSSEAFRIKQDRFKEGLEKTTDFLMSETLMVQKELEYRQAIFEYNLSSEYIKFLTR